MEKHKLNQVKIVEILKPICQSRN